MDAIQCLDSAELPLQQALTQSSHVSGSPRTVIILQTAETPEQIQVKAGLFYAGVIAGSCCADDPTPLCEQPEYCELQFDINRQTAETIVTLLTD
ncbi:MAG: hypothetical protein HZT40_07100 [Candidatus Thiothrix singaporensis]|uniref:Uncharacterized protein n=1 Tax=Candidatus Thiothrix singaporensis TaxID=2799669 RepID=A0A7L6AQL5_9GAMM|nr:MAG: hypothetical protein HZT40_07100 [Candidatus Thiothrix singaporensis]